MTQSYIQQLSQILARIEEDQAAALDRAGREMTDTLMNERLVHLFGSGHSVIPVLEVFPRYGGFVGFNPMTDPRLMWFNVLGPGGVRELLWLERTEGYVEQFLSNQPIREGDTVIVFSHGGLNAAPVEAARYARQQGATVVAVTSLANAERPATHSSGHRLSDEADIVIDTGVPAVDALIEIEGWPSSVGGASTIAACVIAQALVVGVARRLAEHGHVLPTFVSPMAPNPPARGNDAVFDAHRQRLLAAWNVGADDRTSPEKQTLSG
jgi:uncharacterized phosphosugar-binding protein